MPLLAGVVFAEVAIAAVMVWAAPVLTRSFALAPGAVGAILAIAVPVGGVVGVGRWRADGRLLPAVWWSASHGDLRQWSGATVYSGGGLFSVMPAVLPASAALVILIATLTAICIMGTAALTIVVPNELRGLCVAILTGVGALLAIALAPLLVSLLSAQTGGPATIGSALAMVCVGTSVLAATTFAVGRRSFPVERPQ